MSNYRESIKSDKPNIIYILGDDHRGEVMRNMGHPIVETPNLDNLVDNGVLFTNTFCTSPICTPSRVCHYMGQWERRHGVNFNSETSVSAKAWENSFPMQLKKNGYFLGWVGKNHVPAGEGGYRSGYFEEVFDYWYGNHHHSSFYVKRHHPIYSNSQFDTQIEVFEEGAMNFLDPQQEFCDSCIYPLPKRPKDKPFCLCVTFNLPHGAGTGNMLLLPEDDELYKSKYRDKIKDIPLPKTYIPIDCNSSLPINERIPKDIYNGHYLHSYDYVKDATTLRERMVRVFQTVTGMDRMIGHIMQKLQELELSDNTIIVFSTDHGLHWGEHGIGGKCFLYEEDLHIPLIIYDPRMPEETRGQKIDEMVVVPDLAPTVMDMTGFEIPESMQGKSLLSLMDKEENVSWREEFFAEQLLDWQNYPKSECVRTKEWKYIRYFKRTEDPDTENCLYRKTIDNYQDFLIDSLTGIKQPAFEELYHLSEDPYEEFNLAQDERYKDVLVKMRKKLVIQGLELLG